MKILYLAITGASDPTRASIPLHIAANGSAEAGQECAIVLAGDATELVLRGTAERVEGVASQYNVFTANRACTNFFVDAADVSTGAGNTWSNNYFCTTEGI